MKAGTFQGLSPWRLANSPAGRARLLGVHHRHQPRPGPKPKPFGVRVCGPRGQLAGCDHLPVEEGGCVQHETPRERHLDTGAKGRVPGGSVQHSRTARDLRFTLHPCDCTTSADEGARSRQRQGPRRGDPGRSRARGRVGARAAAGRRTPLGRRRWRSRRRGGAGGRRRMPASSMTRWPPAPTTAELRRVAEHAHRPGRPGGRHPAR